MSDSRLSKIVALVEANSFEQMTLWEAYSDKHKWDQDNKGFAPLIGEVDRRPIRISIAFSAIDGVLVGFWEATSQLVDFKMIEDWFRRECPQIFPGDNKYSYDAMNFAQVISQIH
jgi:hypothetical protein